MMNVNELASSYFSWDNVPHLRDPFVIVGFTGWSDAGRVSSDTLEYFLETFESQSFARLSNEPFLNFTMERPMGKVDGGLISYLEPMSTQFNFLVNPDGGHDLIFVLSKEPHFNWLLFGKVFLEVMSKLGVKRLYTVGGVQDTISHSLAPQLSIVASSPGLIADTMKLGDDIRAADYTGPISVHSCLVRTCMENEIEAVSVWGHVPAYLQKSPSVVAKVVTTLGTAAGMECPVEDLKRKSIELDRKIDEALSRDPNLKQFVEALEGRKDSPAQMPGDEKIIRLNDFLRRDPQKDPSP